MGHDRLEVDEPLAEEPHHPRPRCGRVAHAAEDREIAQRNAVGREGQLLVPTGDAEHRDTPALAHQTGRELDCRDRTGRLHDDVEAAARDPARLFLGVLLCDVDYGVRAERERQLQLLVTHAVRDDRRRRTQSGDPDGKGAHRSDPDDADGLGRLDSCPLECLDDAGTGLDEGGRGEGHVVGQRVQDRARGRRRTLPSLRCG